MHQASAVSKTIIICNYWVQHKHNRRRQKNDFKSAVNETKNNYISEN